MASYHSLTTEQLQQLHTQLTNEYTEFQKRGLKLDMSRGKPAADQLELSVGILDVINSHSDPKTSDGFDIRNYGVLDGVKEAKELFAELYGVGTDEIIVGGASSLNMMYDAITNNENKKLLRWP